MSREVKRIPVNFDWPTRKVWEGYRMPLRLREDGCPDCDGGGYSAHAKSLHDLWYGHLPFSPETTGSTRLTHETPAVRAFAERNIASASDYYGTGESAIVREADRLAQLFNGSWSHHLTQADVDALVARGRLMDFTHAWNKETGWQKIEPPVVPTAEQVNEWSLRGFGHDGINCHVVIKARCERECQRYTCATCDGHGSREAYEGQRAEAEAWEKTEPPSGEGWQLWETVSEGSPISPVFEDAESLAHWLASEAAGRDQMPLDSARGFVAAGWAPTGIGNAGGFHSGAEYVGSEAAIKHLDTDTATP